MAATAEAVDPSQSLLNINMSNIAKLNSTNYMTWNIQVHALLDGYELAGHVDGSTQPPPQTVTTNGQSTPNPAYVKWKRQNELIYSALLGIISPSIQILVTKSTTAVKCGKPLLQPMITQVEVI